MGILSAWIRTDERLPAEAGEVLIVLHDHVCVAWYNRDWGFETASGLVTELGDVPYWMPLPDLPKEVTC